MVHHDRFHLRSFVSIALTLSFMIISLTGIVLYIIPPGRVAYWINWKLLGLTKDNWQAIHTIFSCLFIILGTVHLYLNWKPFSSYLKRTAGKGLARRKELGASVVLTLAILAGTILEMPPFSTTMRIGEHIKESWDDGSQSPPTPHTELLTLGEAAEKLGMNPDRVLTKLERNGITVKNTEATLRDIAKENDISPSELYGILSHRGDGGNQH